MSISIRKPINPAVIRKSVVANNTRRISMLQNSQNLILASLFPLETKSELNEIFNEAKKESVLGYEPPFQSVTHLSYYIRKNRNNIDETIKNLHIFIDQEECLTEKLIVNIIDTVLNLLTENSQIINFINKMFPSLISRYYLTNQNILNLEEINNTIGKLIKIGVIYSRQIIENNIDSLFNKISNESYLKAENTKCAIILFICKIIQSSSLFAFNKLTEKKNFKILQNLLENYKDPKKETRELVNELIYQFCSMLKSRDAETRFSYIQLIYMQMFAQFVKNIHDSGETPSNVNIFIGFIEAVKKIHQAEPLFFIKDDKGYEDLVSNCFKSKISKSLQIKIEFIKFVPELYLINKEIFQEKFLNNFFEFCKGYLNLKANQDVRNAVLFALGRFSLILDREKIDFCLPSLMSTLKSLVTDSKIIDKEIFKCLTDLLNNKQRQYLEEIVPKFNIYFILSRLFKTGLTGYKVEFLLSIMSAFNSCSMEHVTAVIISLNVISHIICDEEMNLNYFYQSIKNNKINFISPELEPIKEKVIKHIKKFIVEGIEKDNKNIPLGNSALIFSKCKCLNKPNMIINSLILLSHIQNSYFLKDILIFYNDKILPFLLLESPLIRQKVLQLIQCQFVQIYDDDINFSYYLLNNIVDSIRNIIFTCRDVETKILAFNILHSKTILLDTILRDKNFFFCKLIGLLTTTEDNAIKEKLIQTVGLLALRENDKSFYTTFLNKNIMNILFTISNSEDIIHKENLIKLLLYYTKYLKNIYNSKLVEGALEILINMLFSYDSFGIIVIDILKIICELLDSKIINNLFCVNGVYSQKFNEHCHLLLIICINIISEDGVNSAKSEISLNTIYQIIKLHRINIYKDYTPETLLKYSANNEDNLKNKYQSLRKSEFMNNKNSNKDDNTKSKKSNQKQNKNEEQSNINKELISLLENSSRFNIATILIQTVIKGASDESLQIIMNIFGFSGALDPLKSDKNFSNQTISIYKIEGITIERESIDSTDLKIIRYNQKIKQYEEIDLSMIDPSTSRPVLSLVKILLDNSQQETSNQIINYLDDLVKSLSPKEENLIDILLPTIFHVMPELDTENQKKLFKAIFSIINNFKNKVVYHLNSLIKVIKNCIISEELLDIITDILQNLFKNFVNEMEKYYPTLIPILLSLIKEKMNESADLLKIFSLLTNNRNIGTYLNIILEEIMIVYTRCTEKKVLVTLLDFFEKIISNQNTYLFYPLIIKSLIEKLHILIIKENIKSFKSKTFTLSASIGEGDNSIFVTKTLQIFSLMNETNREHFIKFLPMIIKNCQNFGIFLKPSWEQTLKSMIVQYNGYLFITPMVYQNLLKKENCKINCIMGLNYQKKENPLYSLNAFDEDSEESESSESDEEKKEKQSHSTSKQKDDKNNRNEKGSIVERKKGKNRIGLIDINQIINLFSARNCTSEDDWNEWFKSSSKILFEQSPSYALYYCHYVIDYYFPLIRDLYSFAFYSTIKNIEDESKSKILDDIIAALNSPKTPSDILLTILNLTEYIERKNLGISFFDYNLFGKVAYKCRAFAKALYFKENYFLISKGSIEELIELYYELRLPESAVGLLKYAQKNELSLKKRFDSKYIKGSSKKLDEVTKKKEREDKNAEYIWYIKLHEYQRSLDLINQHLKYEKNESEIGYLKQNKIICLNGLCDWEQIIYDEENNPNNTNTNSNFNKVKTIKELSEFDEDLKDDIEKELVLSKACMSLGEWNKLQYHFSKISDIFKNYHELENQLITKDNQNTEDIYIDDNSFLDLNSEKNQGLGNLNMKYLENLYSIIPKYLTNYDTKISFSDKINECFLENENEKKKDNNVFIPYNEIINSSKNLSSLLNQDDIIFDLNFYSSVLNLKNENYSLALEYLAEDKKMINSRIKSLLGESYKRGYELLIKNQLLFNLEQIIDYKTNHSNDNSYLEEMVRSWDKSLDIVGKDPIIYEKFLSVRSLILPIEKDYNNYMNLAKMFRKLEYYDKSMNILTSLKSKLYLDNIVIGNYPDLLVNEVLIKIELIYNRCLFEKGLVYDAVVKSQYLVDLLEKYDTRSYEYQNYILSRLDDKIKSKVYGDLGIYIQKDFNFNEDLDLDQQFNNSSFLRSSHKNFNIRSLKTLNIQNETERSQEISQNLLNKKIYDGSTINHYLTLSTSYDKSSYKYWKNYAMFNYKYYKFIFDKKTSLEDNDDTNEETVEGGFSTEEKITEFSRKEESFALNAVNGFKYSITLGGKDMNKTFQDLLRLIDIFFNSGGISKNLLILIESSFNSIDVDAYLNVIPQLICRFDLKNEKVLNVLIKILIKIGLTHPNALIYPLIVMKYSSSKARKLAATSVLDGIMKKHKNLIDECEMFIRELNKCAMLPHEEWGETIEDVSKLFQNGDYYNMVEHMKRLHLKLDHKNDSMYEINFFQKYGSSLNEAEDCIKIFMDTHSDEYIKEAWEIYHRVYREISEDYNQFDSISLEYVSPKLYNFRNSNICLPGTYNLEHFNMNKNKDKENDSLLKQNKMIRIQKVGDTFKLFKTKQHPRRMTMIGTNEKEYMFLLKGHEDLRQDERAMQLFDLVNTIVSNNKKTYDKNLSIITYSVVPLSHNAGIIGWVPNCDTLHQLIKDERAKNNILPSAEHRVVYKTYPKFESSTILGKIETFLEALKANQGTELYNMIWSRAKNCESWLNRRTNYSRSLAVMSIVGYILGLGDRHPSNLMMNRKTGKIIHIDFGDCFEVAMKREKFPEKVPFRLTRILIKALEVSEIEGTFRLICEKIMELLRDNKDSLMAILGSFLHDPLISFRLMVPMIMKNKKDIDIFDDKMKHKRMTIKKNLEKKNSSKNNNISISMKITNKPVARLSRIFNPYNNETVAETLENDKKEKKGKREKKVLFKLKEEEKEKEKPESINEDQEKNEKKKMESDERQIFNQYEENDEIDLEELNKIAQIVLDRIQDKLSGTDFNPEIIYDVKSQVDKLIQQATSNENLAQSYLGWCPFW